MDQVAALSVSLPRVPPASWTAREWLAAASSLRPAAPPWPQLPADRTLHVHKGRGAAALACRALGLGPGDEVLAPAYNCGTEIDALRASGVRVTLCRATARRGLDATDLVRRITPATRAVYAVHYFGWPHDLGAVREVCREFGLLLVEDCALSLFARSGGAWTGADADAAVFSFAKLFAVPDGGALVTARPWREAPALRPPPTLRLAWRTAGLVARRFVTRSMRPVPDPAGVPRPDMPSGYYFDSESAARSASRLTLGLLHSVDPATVAARRRANAQRLLEALADVPGTRPLFDEVPAGACPVVFPLVARDREALLEALARRGVDAIGWWAGFHRDLPWDEFPEACSLKRSIVALPVHHGLDADAIDAVASAVKDAVSSRRASRGLAATALPR